MDTFEQFEQINYGFKMIEMYLTDNRLLKPITHLVQ